MLCSFVYSQDEQNHGSKEYDLNYTGSGLTEEQRQKIQSIIQENINTLKAQGKLQSHLASGSILLSWPLRGSSSMTDYGYHIINCDSSRLS
jgi:hypothetical protein